MRSVGALLPLLVLTMAALAAQRVSFSFDDEAVGMPPPGFLFAAARQAAPGTWEVRAGGSLRYLAHTADAAARGLSIAVATAAAPANIHVRSRIRFADGARMGGIVWRYHDASSFYTVGISLERHEALLHRLMGGNRVQLDRLGDLGIDPEAWHTLGVMHHGDQIRVYLDGIAILHARDRGLESGRAGVWSGGAAEAWFDDLQIEEAREPPR